ncbi:EAL domain-containing protein [Bradyrhizobium lablabi]|uniref:EAL domain-containing protein n=1 Tax=Bradyrhizobium lablabi TaxID=722472 RepID=UPI0009A8EE9F|nr:EAL domain-containing protein [Bradyrhizobium lablabi]
MLLSPLQLVGRAAREALLEGRDRAAGLARIPLFPFGRSILVEVFQESAFIQISDALTRQSPRIVGRSGAFDVPMVAVNLSAIQRKRPEVERDILASLTRWKIAPDRIELELTESVLLEATKHHRDIIRRLRAIELRLVIDDFGTGYSSLNYLKFRSKFTADDGA